MGEVPNGASRHIDKERIFLRSCFRLFCERSPLYNALVFDICSDSMTRNSSFVMSLLG